MSFSTPYQRRLLASLFLSLSLSACISAPQRADRMLAAENYDGALELYAQAIKDGSRDPKVFHNAAKASMKLGQLPQAERYFSRALRYGGGPPVARDLAKLYLQSSNYRSAIRVLQYLLNTDSDPQPVYNNLGTALMYAGDVLDAESYLLLAQQLDPKDPTPYINLGLLYDRHYRQPKLAAEFYQCYLQLEQRQSSQIRSVALRIQSITGTDQVVPNKLVTCGKVYTRKPSTFKPGEIRKHFAKELAEDARVRESSEKPEETSHTNEGPKPAPENGGSVKVGADGSKTLILNPEETSGQESELKLVVLRDRARDLIKHRRFQDGLHVLEKLPAEKLNAEDVYWMGRAADGLGQRERAELLFRQSLKSKPSRDSLSALWNLLIKSERKDDAKKVCSSFAQNEALKAEVAMCLSIVKTGGYVAPPKKR